MFDEFFENDIEKIEKKFLKYLQTGKPFYATEKDFLLLITYYSLKENNNNFLDAINLALKYYPHSSEILYYKGLYYYLNTDYKNAIEYFYKSYLYDVENLNTLKYLVILNAYNQNFDESTKYFKKILNSSDIDDDWHLFSFIDEFFWKIFDEEGLWLLFAGEKQLNKSDLFLLELTKEMLDLMISKNKNSEYIDLCFERLACYYVAKQQYENAQTYLNYAIETESYSLNSWLYSAILNLKNYNYNSALKAIEYAVAIEPEIGSEQLILSKILVILKRFNEAIPILENLLYERYENTWEINFLLGKCYASIEEYQVAINFYENCINLKENNIEPYLELASIYLELNKFELAYDYLQKCQNFNSEETEIYYLLANFYLRTHNYAEGLKYINKALEKFPEDVDFILLKSELLEADGKINESLYMLKNFINQIQDSAIIYYRIAGIYVEKNQIDNAYYFLKKASQKDYKLLEEFFNAYPNAKKHNKLTSLLNLT